MKIALIGTSLFHQGAEYVLAAVARGLAERGHDVTVILSKYHDDWQAEHPEWKPFNVSDSVRVIIMSTRKARASIFELRKILKHGHYDVVMSHAGQYTYTLSLSTLFFPRCPKLIHVEHLLGGEVDLEGLPIPAIWTIKTFIHRCLLHRMDALFAVSKGVANALARTLKYPLSQIFTVYNPVMDSLFWKKQQQSVQLDDALKNCKAPLVMAAGAFSELKNHILLIEAFAEVVKTQDARLVIWGDGPLRQIYEEKIHALGLEEKVFLPGFTNNLPAVLKHAACFVVSSMVESFSVVLVEALACGVPVVATDCPYGPREVLANGSFGILVESKNKVSLKEGILKVLNGGGIIPAFEMVEQFTLSNIIRKYEEAISKVLS